MSGDFTLLLHVALAREAEIQAEFARQQHDQARHLADTQLHANHAGVPYLHMVEAKHAEYLATQDFPVEAVAQEVGAKLIADLRSERSPPRRAANAPDAVAAMQKAQRKKQAQRYARRQSERKALARLELDEDWEMVEGDDDWEKVTAEEADDRKELLSSSGSKISILDSGLQ
ncbi:uncharacterized protein RCC_06316 [Ramularia collo-cygni]|uniref:Uncharacterized protein n=1 Tax=Ramularia collo-cygni TaxID=112498 RepID=A0A2D3V9Z7_9PEZI|nr:uncharacterized protein RCC_06316 [Ramularia collo-cygni]CZT20456.1 uncharacterized protein RCC_06316 [Ramularia collo-cygni]